MSLLVCTESVDVCTWCSEVWRAEEDLDLHISSDEYRNLLLVLEMAPKKPEIRFDTLSSSTGIETIEKARSYAR